MNIKTKLIPVGSKRRSGTKIRRVCFFVDHDTGNPNSTAQNNVDYYCRSCNEMSASAHAFIDDKEVVVCIPCMKKDAEKAWHVLYDKPQDNKLYGLDSNDAAIGLELCFFPEDKARTQKAYNNYIEYAAMLCKEHDIEPQKRSAHFELDPGRKSDPKTALKVINKTYEDMKKDIANKYLEITSEDSIYKNAIQNLVLKNIVGSPAAWLPKPNLRNADALITKIGVYISGSHDYTKIINMMVEKNIISSPQIWLNKSYTEQNVRDLIVKISRYLG